DSAGTAYPVQSASVTVVGSCATAGADLTLAKTGPDTAKVGTHFDWTLSVANFGPSAATNVVVADSLPAGTTFVSATASQGSCSGTATVTCSLGRLGFAVAATVTIAVSADRAGDVTN